MMLTERGKDQRPDFQLSLCKTNKNTGFIFRHLHISKNCHFFNIKLSGEKCRVFP